MATKTSKIVKIGNSCFVCLDKEVLFASQLELGDMVEIKCSKNKIAISKVKEN